jgi:hypothetical protein
VTTSEVGPWVRTRYMFSPRYQRGDVVIHIRYRWSYLGGGRQGSVKTYFVERGESWSKGFKLLRDAKAYADKLQGV